MGNKLTAVLRRYVFPAIAAALLFAPSAFSLERVILRVAGTDRDLRKDLKAASLVIAAEAEGRKSAETIFAAALSDYARMLEALYAEGYYSGVVNILIDGREAAEIPLLSTPDDIKVVDIRVDPGRVFVFGDVTVGPLVPGTLLPPGFRPGKTAKAPVVLDAVDAATDRWRSEGYAKVTIAAEAVSADHKTQRLDAAVSLAPGPRVKFGALVIETPSRVRANAIRRIASLPEGEPFSPEAAEAVAQRLRRAGAFGSVTLKEADTLGPDNEMDMLLTVTDRPRRRLGFGAEIASFEGVELSSFWLHRNAFGGAEQLRFDAEVRNIGGSSGVDWLLGARLDLPGPFGRNTRGFAYANFEHLEEPTFTSDTLLLGLGAGERFTDTVDGEIAVGFLYGETTTAFGSLTYSLLTLPTTLTFDNRDDRLNPRKGFYVKGTVTPFLGLNGVSSGGRNVIDARTYHGLGAQDRVVLAGRLQFGSIVGSPLDETYPSFLFHSGGAGTVRGQPYQSLDVDVGNGFRAGGRSFVGLSSEIRADVTEAIGLVAFADAGYIGAEEIYDGSGDWHAGAGLGLRYQTGLGPIRLDVAAPISGTTGDGVQIYVGIGQAF